MAESLGRLVRILETLVTIPTPTGHEARLHPFLVEYLTDQGFDTKIQPVTDLHPLTPPGHYANLIAQRGSTNLLMVAHLDTFPAAEGCGYELETEAGWVRGRGVVDVKGQIASLLVAVAETRAPALVAFVCDEERGGAGSRSLKLDADYGIVLEPTGLRAVVAHAGAVEASLTFVGRTSHGSVPEEGDSAIEKAFAFVEALRSHPIVARQRHPLFPSRQLITVGRVEGGSDVMLVADRCSLCLDVRVLPGFSAAAVRDLLVEMAEGFRAELKIVDEAEACAISEGMPVVQWLREAYRQEAGSELELAGYPSWTDAVNLLQKGIPAVVFGAGTLSVAHTEREQVSLSELSLLSRILKRVLEISR